MERTARLATPTLTASPRSAWPLRLLACLSRWAQHTRTRRQLAQLDDRQLADAGITQSERMAELSKPFWR